MVQGGSGGSASLRKVGRKWVSIVRYIEYLCKTL